MSYPPRPVLPGFFMLFIPMRGYEIPRVRCTNGAVTLFIPMRGYEPTGGDPIRLLKLVIYPHEGL